MAFTTLRIMNRYSFLLRAGSTDSSDNAPVRSRRSTREWAGKKAGKVSQARTQGATTQSVRQKCSGSLPRGHESARMEAKTWPERLGHLAKGRTHIVSRSKTHAPLLTLPPTKSDPKHAY